MLELLAAAIVAASAAPPAAQPATEAMVLGDERPLPIKGRNCGLWQAQPIARRAPDAGARKLIDLPPANLELTVLRLDKNGCSLPVIVRENVSGDGRFASAR